MPERVQPGRRLDAADASRKARLGEDLEQADVAGAVRVGATTELE